MAKIFLSHNNAQKTIVKSVAEAIGHDFIILDCYNFESGAELLPEIKKHIDIADIFVLFLSEEALSAPWVQTELALVRDRIEDDAVKFLPILIDDVVDFDDTRIPRWVKKYILKYTSSQKQISRRIQQKIRETSREKLRDSFFKSKVMVGRDTELSNLYSAYYETINNKYRAIIVSGLPHSGRKRLLKEFVVQKMYPGLLDYNPIRLDLAEDESIDVMIKFLQEYCNEDKIGNVDERILGGPMACVDLCVDMLNDLAISNETILINDTGAIVSTNGKLSDWFCDLISSPRLCSRIHLYVASHYAVSPNYKTFPDISNYIISERIDSLQTQHIRALFNSYAHEVSLAISVSDADFFIDKCNGSPELAIMFVDELKRYDFYHVKKELNNLLQIHDKKDYTKLWSVFSESHQQLLIVLSKFDVITYDVLCELYPKEDIADFITEITNYSLLEFSGVSQKFIRLNPIFADYISRTKRQLTADYDFPLQNYTKKLVETAEIEALDLSSQLYKLKESLKRTGDGFVDRTLLLPSYILKVIVEEYRAEEYPSVISLATKVLYDYKLQQYESVEHAIRYWLCMAYCRDKNQVKVRQEVEYFYEKKSYYTYYFILGFMYRILGGNYLSDAEYNFRKALEHSRNESAQYVSKAENELVLSLAIQGNYIDALPLAKKHYERKNSNSYLRDTYLRCQLYAERVEQDFYDLLNELESSPDERERVQCEVLRAEALYYDKHKIDNAISSLRSLLASKPSVYHNMIKIAMHQICKKQEMLKAYNNIMGELKIDGEIDDSVGIFEEPI